MQVPSLNHLFLDAVDRFQKPDAFKVKRDGTYTDVSHADFAARVERASLALVELGVQPGDRVAILAENRLEWALADYAILGARACNVPTYPTLLPHQIEYILKNSGARAIFVSTAEQLAKIQQIRDNLPELEQVIVFDEDAAAAGAGGAARDATLALAALIERGEAPARADPERFARQARQAGPADLATIIYTSGTTGLPKGVMLTHGNLVANVQSVVGIFDFGAGDICLSFLPLSHVFERTCGHYVMMHQGVSIAYAESVEAVQANLVEVRPTILVSVPRLYEKIKSRVETMVANSPPLRRRIFGWALRTGWRAAQRRLAGRPVTGLLALQAGLADRLVFAKLRARTGGRIRFFISGGAPLSPDVARFFFSAGFLICEGYGLTETSPVLTANPPGRVKLGTVGHAIPGVELRIADDGEILARGPSIMSSYYRNPEATREVIDGDGWFHTGDVGTLDADGYLTITDRKKDLIVTAGGKNIAPQPIENLLKTSRYIGEAVIIGDRRKFAVALIVPDFENLQEYARAQGIAAASPAELCRHPQIIQFMEQQVAGLSTRLAQYERPKKITLVDREFSIETGEITPSLKVKRKVVVEKFRDSIDALYSD